MSAARVALGVAACAAAVAFIVSRVCEKRLVTSPADGVPKHDVRPPSEAERLPSEVDPARQRVVLAFDDAAVGETPKGFVAGLTGGGKAGVWRVLERDDAPSGRRVLVQTEADSTSYRFPVLVAEAPKAKDVRVSVRFRPISGSVDQAGGVVARYVDADRYYVVRANALEDNVRLYRVVDGKREQIASADVSVAPGVWHSLALEVRGKRLTATFDATATSPGTALTAEDDRIPEAGLAGVWTKADSVTAFDDLEVVAFDGE